MANKVKRKYSFMNPRTGFSFEANGPLSTYFIEKLDWGAPDVDHTTLENKLGLSLVSSKLGTRTINITGYCIPRTPGEEAIANLKSGLSQTLSYGDPVTIDIMESNGGPWLYIASITAYVDSAIAYSTDFRDNNKALAKFQVSMTAFNPMFSRYISNNKMYTIGNPSTSSMETVCIIGYGPETAGHGGLILNFRAFDTCKDIMGKLEIDTKNPLQPGVVDMSVTRIVLETYVDSNYIQYGLFPEGGVLNVHAGDILIFDFDKMSINSTNLYLEDGTAPLLTGGFSTTTWYIRFYVDDMSTGDITQNAQVFDVVNVVNV